MVSEAMHGFNHEIISSIYRSMRLNISKHFPKIFKVSMDSEYAKTFYHSLYPVSENIDFRKHNDKRLK
jgi:hypothetical protein